MTEEYVREYATEHGVDWALELLAENPDSYEGDYDKIVDEFTEILDKKVYVVDHGTAYDLDCNIIDVYDTLEEYEDKIWLADTVIDWFSENRDAMHDFARYAGIDERWLERRYDYDIDETA